MAELQKESMESFGYLAPATAAGRSADDSSKPATPGLARGKVLEVKGGGIYGYIRPEDRSGDLEIYFRMEDAECEVCGWLCGTRKHKEGRRLTGCCRALCGCVQLHVNDQVTYATVADKRSAKSGDLRAVKVKLLERRPYSSSSVWEHAFVQKARQPAPELIAAADGPGSRPGTASSQRSGRSRPGTATSRASRTSQASRGSRVEEMDV